MKTGQFIHTLLSGQYQIGLECVDGMLKVGKGSWKAPSCFGLFWAVDSFPDKIIQKNAMTLAVEVSNCFNLGCVNSDVVCISAFSLMWFGCFCQVISKCCQICRLAVSHNFIHFTGILIIHPPLICELLI